MVLMCSKPIRWVTVISTYTVQRLLRQGTNKQWEPIYDWVSSRTPNATWHSSDLPSPSVAIQYPRHAQLLGSWSVDAKNHCYIPGQCQYLLGLQTNVLLRRPRTLVTSLQIPLRSTASQNRFNLRTGRSGCKAPQKEFPCRLNPIHEPRFRPSEC
jgi:hypothetical protein